MDKNFNTSYVVIKPKRQNGKPILNICFNTSYVVIKLVNF